MTQWPTFQYISRVLSNWTSLQIWDLILNRNPH